MVWYDPFYKFIHCQDEQAEEGTEDDSPTAENHQEEHVLVHIEVLHITLHSEWLYLHLSIDSINSK